MQSDGANQTMTALVGFSKVIGSANDAVIKDIKCFVLAETAGVQWTLCATSRARNSNPTKSAAFIVAFLVVASFLVAASSSGLQVASFLARHLRHTQDHIL
jgi:hypothetical protein